MGAQTVFKQLWKFIGAEGSPTETLRILDSKYRESHRAYHNFNHIEACFNEFPKALDFCDHPEAVVFATYFHDAVYDPKAKDNEEQSAELALSVIRTAKLPEDFGRRVASLILATKHATVPTERDEQLIVDVDLSILGQSEATFDKYERNIRAEYTWVPESQFRSGRAAILKSFLARKRIYSTEYFHAKYEATARENLARSLQKLAT